MDSSIRRDARESHVKLASLPVRHPLAPAMRTPNANVKPNKSVPTCCCVDTNLSFESAIRWPPVSDSTLLFVRPFTDTQPTLIVDASQVGPVRLSDLADRRSEETGLTHKGCGGQSAAGARE